MRLHFLASTLVRGGAETMALALSRTLDARGHDVRWSLLRGPGELGETLTGRLAPVTGLARGRFPAAAVGRLRRRLAGSDGLYALDHRNAVMLAAAAAPLAGVPRRLVAVHTTGLWGGRPSLGRAFLLALRSFDGVLALSETHRRYLVERERVPAEKVRIVPNGIDAARFAGAPSRAEARRTLDLDPDAEVLGAVAMLRPEKNHALLLEAAAALVARRPRLRVVLVGEGGERAALESRADRDDLRGRVRFLGRRDDVASILRAFDLFVLPSHPAVETQPVSVLEAMAAGVPVVATRVGDLEAMLEGGGAGALIEPGDGAALVATLEDLLNRPERRDALAARAVERVRVYTLDAAADALERAWSPASS